MIERTKLMLSPKELELVNNTDWILTKQQIILKVDGLLAELSETMKQHVNDQASLLPEAFSSKNAKISKGENYRRLPYVILDYPRHFGKVDTLAVRTMFWWGNFFSVSLQVSGQYKNQLLPVLINSYQLLREMGYWICVHTDPWEHYFEPDNYIEIATLDKATLATMLHRESFFKIGKKAGLDDWNAVPAFIMQSFMEITGLYINYQDGGTNLSPGIPKDGSGL